MAADGIRTILPPFLCLWLKSSKKRQWKTPMKSIQKAVSEYNDHHEHSHLIIYIYTTAIAVLLLVFQCKLIIHCIVKIIKCITRAYATRWYYCGGVCVCPHHTTQTDRFRSIRGMHYNFVAKDLKVFKSDILLSMFTLFFSFFTNPYWQNSTIFSNLFQLTDFITIENLNELCALVWF